MLTGNEEGSKCDRGEIDVGEMLHRVGGPVKEGVEPGVNDGVKPSIST
jgi:hypothetical protein